jgi:hypothetical protein
MNRVLLPRTLRGNWRNKMKMQRSNMLILILLVFCSCGSSSVPTRENSASMKAMNRNASPTETVEAYLERFNTWYKKAHLPVSLGFEKALSELVLEDGGEWDCYWEMDYKTINAAVREALSTNDVLHPELTKVWLAVLESLDAKNEICTVGRLFFSEKFVVPAYGDKMGVYYLPNDGVTVGNGSAEAIFVPEYFCGGSTVTGVVYVKLVLVNGKYQMIDSEYREDE